MIDLQKEAEEYRTNPNHRDKSSFKFERIAFIAGANSKYVQAEKIMAQIDIILEISISEKRYKTETETSVLKRLREQLKNLENDTNRNE